MQSEDLGFTNLLHTAWIDDIQKQVKAVYDKIDERKAQILALPDNWNDEGAKIIAKHTVDLAESFIKRIIYLTWKKNQRIIIPPSISPVPDGSIDIHWKTDKFDLLINIPANSGDPATFSGDNYGQNSTKGTFDLNDINPLLNYWILEYL